MDKSVTIRINGGELEVAAGTTVAAALWIAGVSSFRKSVGGEPRGPACGMGVCMECCVTIDGVAHSRSCQTLCRAGMEIITDG